MEICHRDYLEYSDIYEGIQSEILSNSRFDKNSDLRTTYLVRTDTTKTSKIKGEETVLISEQNYWMDHNVRYYLIQGLANHSCLSHIICIVSHFIHSIFAFKTQKIQVGNEQDVKISFIIPVIVDIQGHRFEIYTLVSAVHENVDLVLSIMNTFELEGDINS